MLKLWQAHPYSTKRRRETVITPKMKRRIKRALSAERPTVWVGKEGATTQIINEISKQLDTREMIKAKILKTALKDEETKNIATKIAQQTDSLLIEVRGHTFLLYKRKKKKRVKTL
jgi:RNA-binding protein